MPTALPPPSAPPPAPRASRREPLSPDPPADAPAAATRPEARAERAFEAGRLGYGAGVTDLQTALSAEQSWRAVRAQLTAAQVQAQRRAVQAYKALGGGWPADDFSDSTSAR